MPRTPESYLYLQASRKRVTSQNTYQKHLGLGHVPFDFLVNKEGKSGRERALPCKERTSRDIHGRYYWDLSGKLEQGEGGMGREGTREKA